MTCIAATGWHPLPQAASTGRHGDRQAYVPTYIPTLSNWEPHPIRTQAPQQVCNTVGTVRLCGLPPPAQGSLPTHPTPAVATDTARKQNQKPPIRSAPHAKHHKPRESPPHHHPLPHCGHAFLWGGGGGGALLLCPVVRYDQQNSPTSCSAGHSGGAESRQSGEPAKRAGVLGGRKCMQPQRPAPSGA